ncbi:MAG TPA: hypothetical protein VFO63_18290 [Blastocatellia bacterium]|nr:hypothetical protein [Blastocatellia bacterium]
MTTGTKEALAVKAIVIGFMNEQVYRGDYDNPRLRPDPAGRYHYKDKKIEVSLTPSKRDGWLNAAVTVQIVRRRWPFRRVEPVLVTGHGVDVSTYRPGLWVDYITELSEKIKEVQRERDEEAKRKIEEDERHLDANFSPVDDSAIFKK